MSAAKNSRNKSYVFYLIIFLEKRQKISLDKHPSNFSYLFLLNVNFENLTVRVIHTYKISRKSIINNFVNNQMLKFQVFLV